MQITSYSPRIFFSIILLSTLALNSCKVVLLPAYDAEISQQIQGISKKVDRFYLLMLESTSAANGSRDYIEFAREYVDIEVELNALLTKNKVRPLNENSTRICEITLQLWIKYKEEHKEDNTLSDGLIKLNRMTFNDLFYAMQVAEAGKKIINNPPE